MKFYPPFLKSFLMYTVTLTHTDTLWVLSPRHKGAYVCVCVKNLSKLSTESPQSERKITHHLVSSINKHTPTRLSGSRLEVSEILYKALETKWYKWYKTMVLVAPQDFFFKYININEELISSLEQFPSIVCYRNKL